MITLYASVDNAINVTQQNNYRVTQWTFPYKVYLVRPLAEIRQYFEKWFSVSRKGSKMKHFPFKFWHLKFSFLLFSKIATFAKFSKNHVLSFSLLSGLCAINSIQRPFDF